MKPDACRSSSCSSDGPCGATRRPLIGGITDHLIPLFAVGATWVRQAAASNPDRDIAVVVPELVRRRWYHFFVSHRATLLKTLLLLHGNPRILVISTPLYLDEEP